MLYRYVYTRLFKLIYKRIKALRLEMRGCFIELVGAGIVAENTLKDEIREFDYLLYKLNALVVILKSDTRHTGVESDMKTNGLSEGNRPIGQTFRHFIGVDILRDTVVYQQIVLRGRGIAKNEDRLFYTCTAKLDRLFNDGDAEIIDLALKLMRKLDRAVAVAVRFDNRKNLCPLGYTALALTEIVKNRIYIYPCIYTMILHRYRFLCQIIWASGAVSIPFALSSAFIRFANSTALTPSPCRHIESGFNSIILPFIDSTVPFLTIPITRLTASSSSVMTAPACLLRQASRHPRRLCPQKPRLRL